MMRAVDALQRAAGLNPDDHVQTDLLQMDTQELYFDRPLPQHVEQLIKLAAESYGEPEAENMLQTAYKELPEHPMVHVALYRYYYYQHRLEEALEIADQTIAVSGRELNYDGHWRDVTLEALNASGANMVCVRFYLMALKAAGFICLRTGRLDEGNARLRKVAALDIEDRLGASAILQAVDGRDR